MTELASARFYPWQSELQRLVWGLHLASKLPHALLLSGPRHLGKRGFASAFAGMLHCRSPGELDRCGTCENCLLFAAGTHPDHRHVSPEDSKLIRIEQIRDLIVWAGKTAQRGGMKTIVLEPAEQMNVYAANALLKCLEEPAGDTLFMLVSHAPGRLLPTIRSRCQHIDFLIPPADTSLAWLRGEPGAGGDAKQLDLLLSIGGGAPLSVVAELDDEYMACRQVVAGAIDKLMAGTQPLEVARTVNQGEPMRELGILYSLFADALRLSLTDDENFIKNKDMGPIVGKLSRRAGVQGLTRCLEAIARERRAVAGPSNPNIALLLDGLMVEIAGQCTSRNRTL